MLDNLTSGKKIALLSGGIVLLVVIVFGATFILKSNKKNNSTQQPASGQVSSGSGNVDTSTKAVTITPGVFRVHTDPSKPFASIKPRQGEGDELAIQPVQPPVVAAPTPTISSSDINNPDYANLNSDQFLAKYYPDAAQTISGSNIPNLPGNDPAIINYTDPNAGPNLQPIPDQSGLSSSKFSISSDNSVQAIGTYTTALARETASLDLAGDPNLITSIIQSPDQGTINAQLKEAQDILNNLQKLSTPSSLAGMQKETFNLYQNYVNLLTDMTAANSFGQPAAKGVPQQDPNTIAAKIKNDVGGVTTSLSRIAQDRAILGEDVAALQQ